MNVLNADIVEIRPTVVPVIMHRFMYMTVTTGNVCTAEVLLMVVPAIMHLTVFIDMALGVVNAFGAVVRLLDEVATMAQTVFINDSCTYIAMQYKIKSEVIGMNRIA
jgi:hypothetical protein